ncbi:hypothetical protein PUR71_11935 [Streptomyces sp. SP17BM10]|uniref:hypothetical protein n=1 Tax=Streptomyces sp. SP17BM10 TaxID=3002530 RepID=UPI002E75F2AD|nr:hypothetical protein [Streptomyces sp. SP17BM10]MEE1783611.1 hypothetical protein [Streptomyces sp. SP17BM10]
MHEHRATVGPAAVASAAVALVLHGLLLRPRMLTWGATSEEAARSYPGDELIPGADTGSTMATTLPAPPSKVWPWLVQMGCDRGGWYSWDRLDNGGRPSVDRVVPEWQSLAVGQRLTSVSSGRAWFTVAVLVPERTLVLRDDTRIPSGRPFDPTEERPPRAFVSSAWGFHLEPAGANSRLVVRTHGRSRPRVLTGPIDLLFWEPAHFVMQTRQFHNLRARLRRAVPGHPERP